VADLCPAIFSGRSWVGMFAERSVSTLPTACCATPPSAPFSRLLPLRACISLLSVCPSLSLFCARRAPAKMLRNAEISKNLRAGPRYVQTAAEKCRGVAAFFCVWCLVPIRGATMCKTHLIKPYNPPPFLVPSAISERLGFGMRLARIAYSSARQPYSAMPSPVINRRGTGWRWERKSERKSVR
jgi:hypothetical protein